jgi:glycosyltransferase involved in cell wall biosynthesis
VKFPRLTVVICSLNGQAGVDRCIRALAKQTIRHWLELVVVDDGSSVVIRDSGWICPVTVVRHSTNLGLAAARNSGVDAAAAPIVAFLDDDCQPNPQWAEQLLAAYDDRVIGVGGPVLTAQGCGFMLGYLTRNNPLKPQESSLARSNKPLYRLRLYVEQQWTRRAELPRREVFSFAGANMSFLRTALLDTGKFDERFRFGAEELDICIRMRRAFPNGRLVFAPEAQVVHHFRRSIRDTLRRSRAYGQGSARLYRKWPSVPPTFFPWPVVLLATLLASARIPVLAAAAVAAPQLLYPQGLRHAVTNRTSVSLLDAYVQLAQETWENLGFIEGLWRFRHLETELERVAAPAAKPQDRARFVP